MILLVVACWAGLMRLGWSWPRIVPGLMAAHGPLMVSGFLGTLIGIERAVALGRRWMYAGPLLAGLGGLALVAGLPAPISKTAILLGSLGLLAIFVVILQMHFALYTVVMALGVVAWLVGNIIWFSGVLVPRVFPWWAGFLVLTVVGERLELGRLVKISLRAQGIFVAATVVFFLGLVLSVINFDAGVRLYSVGMSALGVWLLLRDVARVTIRKPGLTRFTAVCMLSGYIWLVVGGAMGVIIGGVTGGPHYDALLHGVFLGFVFAMIFGHAPIIFPAVLNRPLGFSRRFYLHLVLLHASLVLRVVGDLVDAFVLRRWGGLLNALALLLFLLNTVVSVRKWMLGGKAGG